MKLVVNRTMEAVGEVVWSILFILVHSTESIALVSSSLAEWTVDWNLHEVWSQSVSVGVAVGKESSLKHLVRAGFNTRYQVGWTECYLLNFSKVVLRVPVKN
uniref:Catalase n=1 Tax=Ornithodoros moubata TaxID=6938 RepID=A0A1Z5KZ21_ORNMO